MDGTMYNRHPYNPLGDQEPTPELVRWFEVSGDLDDFIYFGEEPKHSEK